MPAEYFYTSQYKSFDDERRIYSEYIMYEKYNICVFQYVLCWKTSLKNKYGGACLTAWSDRVGERNAPPSGEEFILFWDYLLFCHNFQFPHYDKHWGWYICFCLPLTRFHFYSHLNLIHYDDLQISLDLLVYHANSYYQFNEYQFNDVCTFLYNIVQYNRLTLNRTI